MATRCLGSAWLSGGQLVQGSVGYCVVGDGIQCLRSQGHGRQGNRIARLGDRVLRDNKKRGERATVVPQAISQWNRRPELAGETPRVVVITSWKGGVGKTTTTANLGMCLARWDFKVVAIDAHDGKRNLGLLLGLENQVTCTAMEVLNGECGLDQALISDKLWKNLELLCINKPRCELPLGFGGKALTGLVDVLKKRNPHFILIDCPAGIDAGFNAAITPANEAILVTTPDSLRDADSVRRLLERDGIENIKMVVNKVRRDMIKRKDMRSVLVVQGMPDLPLLGVIPKDSEVNKSTDRGYPLVLTNSPTLAGLALERGYPLVLKNSPTLAGLELEQIARRLVEKDSM